MNDPNLKKMQQLHWVKHISRHISFFHSFIHLTGYYNYYAYYLGKKFNYLVVEGRDSEWLMYRNKEESEEMAAFVGRKAKSKSFLKKALAKSEKAFRQLHTFSLKVKETDLENLSNQELAELFSTYATSLSKVTIAASILILLSDAVSQQLEKTLTKKLDKQKRQRALGVLSSPFKPTTVLTEEKEFIKLVKGLQANPLKVKALAQGWPKELNQHFNKFKYINAYFDGPDWDKKRFLNRAREALQTDLEEMPAHKETDKKVQKLVQEYALDAELVALLRKIMFYRIEAEMAYGFANHCTRKLFALAAKRLGLTVPELKKFTFKEVINYLQGKEKPAKNKVKERKRYAIFVTPQGLKIFSGAEAESFTGKIKLEEETMKLKGMLKGLSASHGLVKGRVKVVLDVTALAKVEKGDVLIAPNTTPAFVPAMKKASAIVTDEGGITCHAAIVSRELGIPCVTGTRQATAVLKDGDLIEVDATKGLVRIVRKVKK